MILTRRDFSMLIVAGAPYVGGLMLGGLAPSEAKATPRINSVIDGVQFGLEPFCYHDLPMNIANRPILIQRMIQNQLGVVELQNPWVEPNFSGPGVSPQEAREKMRQWRLTTPPEYFRKIKQEFDDAGISIYTLYDNMFGYSDAEVHATFIAAKALGAKGVVGSFTISQSKRLAPFPGKYGMFLGLHNHDNLSDPNAYATAASLVEGLSFSPDFKVTLDTRHFTAANQDCIAFMEKHHDRMDAVHLGDRRRNNGQSTPFGQGDAPLIEILWMIRDNHWPIVVLLEFEQGTLLTGVQEVQVCYDYCKRALEY